MDERALVEAVLAGDRRARRQFVARYLPAVKQSVALTARGRMGAADLDDAVQHIFLSLFARDAHALRLWKGDASLKGYLKAVARNLAIRQLGRSARDQGRFRLVLDAPAAGDPDGPTLLDVVAESAEQSEVDAETRLRLRQERESLRAAIVARLSERGRQMYGLLFVEELDVETVVERAKVTPNNVYQWRARIAEVARKVLAEAGYAAVLLGLLGGPPILTIHEKLGSVRKIPAADRLTESVGPIPGAPRTREGR